MGRTTVSGTVNVGSNPALAAKSYWLSNKNITIIVDVKDDRVYWTPPVAAIFIGQPFGNLVRWMKGMGGFVLFEY